MSINGTDDDLQTPPLSPMVKQFCLNWEKCGYRQYQYLNEEPSLCGQCLYNNEEKMKEENKGKETNKVILKRPRSDTVADFNLSALETGSGFKKKQHK